MTTFTDDQVRQQLETVLNAATNQGEVRIKSHDGKEFAVRPISSSRSPFDIPGINLNLTADEIVSMVREGRDK